VAWVTLIYTVAALVWIRWQNVESHRHVLEYLKAWDKYLKACDKKDYNKANEEYNKADKEYNKAKSIIGKGRKLMISVFISMLVGLILIAVFTAMIIYKEG